MLHEEKKGLLVFVSCAFLHQFLITLFVGLFLVYFVFKKSRNLYKYHAKYFPIFVNLSLVYIKCLIHLLHSFIKMSLS